MLWASAGAALAPNIAPSIPVAINQPNLPLIEFIAVMP
jgi:hypothetical protein